MTYKERAFELLGGATGFKLGGRVGSFFIMALIILNCVAMTLETIAPINARFDTHFYWFELFSIAVFSIEYVARCWSCTVDPRYAHPVRGRIRFMFSPMAIIDLLAILPFYLTFFVTDLRFLRVLRLLRIFRIFKLVRYSKALITFGRIAASKKEELVITGVMGLILIFVASSFMYLIENEAQPGVFASIPHAMWWAIITLTTVGYGDVVPITIWGKIFNSVIAVIGIGMFALPAGILGSAFVLEEIFGGRRKVNMRNHYILCGLGKIGVRVLEQLQKLGMDVVVVEQDDDNKFLDAARNMNVPIIIGDIRLASTLNRADVGDARCLIALSDNDLANLEAALTARSVKENIHIVLRVFEDSFAAKLQTGFGIEKAFSPSALAAPAFALAAVDPSVVGSFYVGDDLMLNMEIVIKEGAELDGMTTGEFEKRGHLSILAHESATTGRRQLHLCESMPMSAGDLLVISTTPDFSSGVHKLNTPS